MRSHHSASGTMIAAAAASSGLRKRWWPGGQCRCGHRKRRKQRRRRHGWCPGGVCGTCQLQQRSRWRGWWRHGRFRSAFEEAVVHQHHRHDGPHGLLRWRPHEPALVEYHRHGPLCGFCCCFRSVCALPSTFRCELSVCCPVSRYLSEPTCIFDKCCNFCHGLGGGWDGAGGWDLGWRLAIGDENAFNEHREGQLTTTMTAADKHLEPQTSSGAADKHLEYS